MFCIAIVILVWTSLRDRNAYIESRAGKILIYSLSTLLLPSIILVSLQAFVINPFMESTIEKRNEFISQNRYLGSINLEWDGKIINEKDKLESVEKTISQRLHNNKQVSAITSSSSSDKDIFVTKIVLSPHSIPADDPASDQHVRSIIKSIESPTSNSSGEDILSIRTVLMAPEEDTPAGFEKLPWKDGFVYVAKASHVTAHDIFNAQVRNKDTLLATLTEAGQLRMNAMARYTDASKSQVALIHHGKIIGIYEPQLAMTDQFIISPIPKDIAAEEAANELSMPHLGAPANKIKFDYTNPTPMGFRYELVDTISALPGVVVSYLWLGIMFLMLAVTCVGLLILHSRTKTLEDEAF